MTELIMPKVVWVMGEKPTGRFRSFHHRSWPTAFYHRKDGPIAARIMPIQVAHKSYFPQIKEIAELQIGIADYRVKDQSFVWRRLTMAVTGYTAATELFETWLYEHLEDWRIPNE